MITRKVDYALRILMHLAKNRDAALTTGEVSRQIDVPMQFLAKIVNTLSRAGIITAERGKAGGIKLSGKAVSVSQILLLFEPDFAMNKCLMSGFVCNLKRRCPLHPLIKKMQADLLGRLSRIDLLQLAQA